MTEMRGREALMQIFRREEVEFIFGIPGATEVVLMDSLEDHPEFKFILGLHETVAMGMAEGYARVTGKPGILNFHTNTGLAASLPLLYNAFTGRVPLIVTAGQQDTRMLAQEPALGADLVRIAAPFTKWSTEITSAADIPLIMRRAFKMALQPPQGPIFVSLPQNLLEQSLEFEYTRGALPFIHQRPDIAAVKAAADMISEAASPVMVVEDGVTRSGALEEVVHLAEICGARVYQQWMSDVNFPAGHHLYMGELDVNSLAARELLEKSDLLIVIGAPFFSQAVYTSQSLVPSGLKIIQIDDNPWQIGKNFPVTVNLEGHIRTAVEELVAILRTRFTGSIRDNVKQRTLAAAEANRVMKEAWHQQAFKEKEQMPPAATRIMDEIKTALPEHTRVVDDCWSYSAVLRRTLAFSEERSYFRARGGGSIGWGLPGALGVKLASPQRPVVCVSGDGSAMWSIQSLWTAAHYDIPVTYIILANSIYRQVRVMKARIMGDEFKGRNLGTDIGGPRIDFAGLAKSMGLPGVRVEHPGELSGALKTAFSLNKPNLVEITVDGKI